jgi:hypothetical protein
MMEVLRTVKRLNLPNWWIGAGFVRSKVWDTLHGYNQRTPLPDIDAIYFNRDDFSDKEAQWETTNQEIVYERKLKEVMPSVHWSVTNQARMHLFHHDNPYQSSEEALSRWVETATCIGARLDENNHVVLATPRGIEDLVNLILRPTPGVSADTKTFYERIEKKEWLKKWPKLKVVIS